MALMRFIVSQLFFTILLVVISLSEINARHLVGGDATYTFVRFNSDSTQVTFLINFSLYRDANNGSDLFDRENFGLYREISPGNWEFVDDYQGRRTLQEDIPAIDEPCREEPSSDEVGVEAGLYEFTITIDIGDENYMLAYLRCCRNSTIFNMQAFEEGVVFDLIITPEAQRTGNNSPTFNEFPPIFICAGFPLDVSLQCSDLEGDSLVYSYCTPLAIGGAGGQGCDNAIMPDREDCPPPYKALEYQPLFSESAPMGGDPVVTIDPTTGQMTGVPEFTGQYVIGICVEEYRNGVLLSRLRRDFQFNAITCIKELSADLVADEVVVDNSMGISRPISIIKACGDSLVNFRGIDGNNTIINYHWQVNNPSGIIVVDTSGRNVRDLDVRFPQLGEYIGTLAVEDSEGCKDTAIVTVQRLPDMYADFEYEILDSCYLGSVQFKDLSSAEESEVIEWEWDFASESVNTEKDPSFEFSTRGNKKVSLISKDLNGCIDTFTLRLNYDPPHDKILESTQSIILCHGETLPFGNDIITEAGDYEEIIKYAQTGCDSIYRYLTVDYHPKPEETDTTLVLCPGESIDYYGVNYNTSQITKDGFNDLFHTTKSISVDYCDSIIHNISYKYEEIPFVTFSENYTYVIANEDFDMPISISGDFESIIWTPSTGLDCTDCPYPVVNSEIDSQYTVLVVTDDNCEVVDSIFLDFVVVPERYYIPSVLSQQSIRDEDRFFFLMTQENAYESVTYSMNVYDKWGGLLFNGNDLHINEKSEGWSARGIQPGAYTYYMEIKEFFESRVLVGTITIIE